MLCPRLGGVELKRRLRRGAEPPQPALPSRPLSRRPGNPDSAHDAPRSTAVCAQPPVERTGEERSSRLTRFRLVVAGELAFRGGFGTFLLQRLLRLERALVELAVEVIRVGGCDRGRGRAGSRAGSDGSDGNGLWKGKDESYSRRKSGRKSYVSVDLSRQLAPLTDSSRQTSGRKQPIPQLRLVPHPLLLVHTARPRLPRPRLLRAMTVVGRAGRGSRGRIRRSRSRCSRVVILR